MPQLYKLDNVIDQIFRYVYIINTCTIAIGLPGNITALVVISSSKSFHTLTGFYLLNLTTADLFILALSHLFYHEFSVPTVGIAAFFIVQWMIETSAIVSTLTITAFTVERYLAICHPFFVQSTSKKSRVKRIIIAIWISGALLAIPPVVLVMNYYVKHRGYEDVMPYVADIRAVLYFFMPMLAIDVMYGLIWWKLKKSSSGTQIASCKIDRTDKRTMMMFVTIIVAFFLSWAPYCVHRIINGHIFVPQLRNIESRTLDFDILLDEMMISNLVQRATYPLSSALNPIIYSVMSRQFREAFKDLIFTTKRELDRLSSKLTGSINKSDNTEITS